MVWLKGTVPVEVHTSLLNNTNLAIMWVTSENTSTSTVEYSVDNTHNLTIKVHGTTHTYTAGGWKGVIHEVCLLQRISFSFNLLFTSPMTQSCSFDQNRMFFWGGGVSLHDFNHQHIYFSTQKEGQQLSLVLTVSQ